MNPASTTLLLSECSVYYPELGNNPGIINSKHKSLKGFTLIELSIVLVIIGLIVGGVLVGRNLIDAAAVRSQISQIEKYQTAVNTFRGKYGYLPGDIPNPVAGQFGFQLRGQYAGEGDGNGVIEGITADAASSNTGVRQSGEITMFWVDLSFVNLIDGTFSAATPIAAPAITSSQTYINTYLPQAKINSGMNVYVFSLNATNYYGLSVEVYSFPGIGLPGAGITVLQAYSIDKKIDDGLPASGNVTTEIGGMWVMGPNYWSAYALPLSQAAQSGSCIDNGGVSGATYTYSISQNAGAGVNCALSFRLQ